MHRPAALFCLAARNKSLTVCESELHTQISETVVSHVGPCCPCDHRCQRLPDAYAGTSKRSDKCPISDGSFNSARSKDGTWQWFRDEAKFPGIKLNSPGQIRFVSSWGDPRLLQVQAR